MRGIVMAKYKLTERAYLVTKDYPGCRVYEAEDIVDLPDDTVPGPHMIPINELAEKEK
jgi:hypothetical protein